MLTVVFFLTFLELVALVYLFWHWQFLKPKKGKDWLAITRELKEKLNNLVKKEEKLNKELKVLKVFLNHSYLTASLVRFSAFSEVGASQSFSLCLLNLKGDGIILTNIFTNQASRVYLKEIKAGQPTIPLSPEEKEAWQKASRQLQIISLKSRQMMLKYQRIS